MKYMAHVFIKDEDGYVIDDEFLFGHDKIKLIEAVKKFVDEKSDGETKELVGIFSLKCEDGENQLPNDTEEEPDNA